MKYPKSKIKVGVSLWEAVAYIDEGRVYFKMLEHVVVSIGRKWVHLVQKDGDSFRGGKWRKGIPKWCKSRILIGADLNYIRTTKLSALYKRRHLEQWYYDNYPYRTSRKVVERLDKEIAKERKCKQKKKSPT